MDRFETGAALGLIAGALFVLCLAVGATKDQVCTARWEYAETQADSLALYREHPACAGYAKGGER